MKKFSESSAAKYTIILILVTFVLRILIAAYTGLGIGESYYFRGALKLELSYFDQPPLFFWLSGLTIKIFGLTALGLRFPAVLLFAGTSWLLFLVTKQLFNAKAGFWAVLLINLSAVFTISVACWYQPDAPLMFFWMLSIYLIVKILGINDVQHRSTGNIYLLWILAGISTGLATLSKYHVIFLFAGLFLYIITNKDQRKWLRHPGPYIAVLITFIMAFPILWWNYNNHWVSFVFQGSRAGTSTQKGHVELHPEWFLRSIIGQSLWLLPWIWVPMMGALIRSYKDRNISKAYSFCFWTAILPIVFFTVVTLWSNLQYHFHWQAPGYMMLFMPLGYAVDQNLTSGSLKARSTRRWLRFSACFTVITIGVLSIHMVTGFWQYYGPKWIVQQAHGDNVDPTIQGIDYDDIKTYFEQHGYLNNPKIFTGTPRWWLTGKVDWVLRGQKPIAVFSDDPRNLAFMVDPQKLVGDDCIIIGQEEEPDVMNNAKPFFDSVQKLPDIVITRHGRDELHLQAYYGKNFHKPATPREDLPLYRQLTGRSPF